MAASTLLPRLKPHRKPSGKRELAYRQPPPAPAASRLHDVEERLLTAAIVRHPARERAITHLLSDIERPTAADASVRRNLPTPHPSSHQRMDDLLFEAFISTHPNRSSAIDRLLGDVVGDAGDMDSRDKDAGDAGDIDEGDAAPQVLMPLSELEEVDNDFDGMG